MVCLGLSVKLIVREDSKNLELVLHLPGRIKMNARYMDQVGTTRIGTTEYSIVSLCEPKDQCRVPGDISVVSSLARS